MKKNKKTEFFVKLLSLIVCVVLFVSFINYKYINGYYYYSVYSEINAMYDVPEKLTMVNFGTSHGLCSFRYDENDKQSYNLALSGSDIYHNFVTLKQFSSHLESGCIVAIPISYFSFCMSTDEPSQKRYYLYLEKEYIREFSYETLINAKYLPVLRSGEFLIKDIIKDENIDAQNMVTASISNADVFEKADVGYIDNTLNCNISETDTGDGVNAHIDELNSHATGRAISWRLGYMQPYESYMQNNIDILVDMVNYCYDNGFKPVLVSTPVYYKLNEQFTETELNKYYFDNIDNVVDVTGVPYLDLSHDFEISNKSEYFGNSDHLNEDGAKAFFEKFENYLKMIGYKN